MKVFLSKVDGDVIVQARFKGAGLLGEVTELVPLGGEFLGHSHDELVAMGEGEVILDQATSMVLLE